MYQDGEIYTETQDGSEFVYVINGTSFAAPQISGAAALLAQAFPNLSGREIVSLLLYNARYAGASGTDSVYGRGILDIGSAFQPSGVTTLAGSELPLSLVAAAGMAAWQDAQQAKAQSGQPCVTGRPASHRRQTAVAASPWAATAMTGWCHSVS